MSTIISGIKVGFCVAYDWIKLRHSLPAVYGAAETICIALDRQRRTWSGQPYAFDENGFRSLLSSLDPEGRIDLYEDDFFVPGQSPIENDTRQRNLLAARMGRGGWHIQLDVDEYFIDFPAFASSLLKLDARPTARSKPLRVSASWIPLFKRVDGGYVIVDFADKSPERTPVATNAPAYRYARLCPGKSVELDAKMIHETWARDENDLRQKLDAWGHAHDFAVESYFALWKAVDARNCGFLHNLHPLTGTTWPRLRFCSATDLDDLIRQLAVEPAARGRPWYSRL